MGLDAWAEDVRFRMNNVGWILIDSLTVEAYIDPERFC